MVDAIRVAGDRLTGQAAVAVGVMMDTELVNRALRVYGEAITLVEPLRVRFWQEHGLTIPQIGLMFVLYEDTRLSGPSVGELPESLQRRRATVTGLVTRLERAGYAHRGEPPSTPPTVLS